jgi:hypothetical protein
LIRDNLGPLMTAVTTAQFDLKVPGFLNDRADLVWKPLDCAAVKTLDGILSLRLGQLRPLIHVVLSHSRVNASACVT